MRKTLVSATLFTGVMFAMTGSASAEVKVGDDVPDFEMVGSDGATYSNAQFKNKQAFIIAWFPKAFTGG